MVDSQHLTGRILKTTVLGFVFSVIWLVIFTTLLFLVPPLMMLIAFYPSEPFGQMVATCIITGTPAGFFAARKIWKKPWAQLLATIFWTITWVIVWASIMMPAISYLSPSS